MEVTSGDVISINTKYYFTGTSFTQNTHQTVAAILGNMAGIFIPGVANGTATPEQLLQAQQSFTQNNQLSSFITEALGVGSTDPATAPKAYLTWLMFDKKFGFIPAASGMFQVENPDQLGNLGVLDLKVPQNGYLYIYVSNETAGAGVSFDNL